MKKRYAGIIVFMIWNTMIPACFLEMVFSDVIRTFWQMDGFEAR